MDLPDFDAGNRLVPLMRACLELLAEIQVAVADLRRLIEAQPPDANSGDLAREYISIKGAAALSGLSEKTIRRAIHKGSLPASDVGTDDLPHYRIAKADFSAWMDRRKGGAGAPPEIPIHRRKIKSRHFGEI